MNLTALVGDYIALRADTAPFVLEPGALKCAINATRFFAGWQTLADVTAITIAGITGATNIADGEWAVIGPLFHLYVEREAALIIEASRQQGVELVGRSSSEVASEISQIEAALPQQAYLEEVFSVGITLDPSP